MCRPRGMLLARARAGGRRRSRERRAGDDPGMPNYLIRKKLIALGDDFWVEDDEGRRIFHVDGKALRLRKTFVIETPEGEELVQVKERKLSVRKAMTIERRGEEIATVRKALVTPLRDRFEIEVTGGGVLNAHGDILDHEFTIAWENDVPFAQVSKRRFAVRDAYGLSIEPDQDAVLALAIAVCIDAMERDEV
jgi:uncharacterized protein YxjI